MASKATFSLALLLSLNLLFFSLVAACNDCHIPPYPKPIHLSDLEQHCPIDSLKLGVCARLLGGLLDTTIGNPPVTPCCSLISGLVDLEAAVCFCTVIRARVSGINVNIPLQLSLLLNICERSPPNGFQC